MATVDTEQRQSVVRFNMLSTFVSPRWRIYQKSSNNVEHVWHMGEVGLNGSF